MSPCLKLWLWNGFGSWGWIAGQVESVADGGSWSEHWVKEAPQAPCACWLLFVFPWSDLWLWFFMWRCCKLLVPHLRFWTLQDTCHFLCSCLNTGLHVRRVILQYNQLLYGCVGKAEPLPVSSSLSSCGLSSPFLLGHGLPHGVAGWDLLLVKPKSKLGSGRNLHWFPSLWAWAVSRFVHSVLVFSFSGSFLRARAMHFFSGSWDSPLYHPSCIVPPGPGTFQRQRLFG